MFQQALHIIVQGGQHVLNFLNGIPPEYWVIILGSIPVSAIIIVFKTAVKRKWDKAPSETKMFLTNFGALVAIAVGTYLSTTPTDDPVNAIFSMVGLGLLVQQPVYFRFIKPLITLAWQNYDSAKQLNEEMKSAAVPPAGVPLEK